MVILVDTNIIIDALANREPYADDAKRIMCGKGNNRNTCGT